MLRINLEIWEGDRMRQVGELFVKRTDTNRYASVGDYSVHGWATWPPGSASWDPYSGEVNEFYRDGGVMRLAELALAEANRNCIVDEDGNLIRGESA